MKKLKKDSPILKITEEIKKNGCIPEQSLKSNDVETVKKLLTEQGYKTGLQTSKPEHHFTGIRMGSTFYLWAIPSFQYNRLTES